jgi:cytoskeletal protein CcmA (bactofilin family)
MSIFNKPPAERPVTRLDTPPADAGAMSVIANGMRIMGDVESNGIIKVEGIIEGAVRGARQLLLGRSGVVHGDIHAGDAVLGGKVVGAVIATERVEIQGTASVEGDIHTKSIVVFEGGSINGSVRMGENAATPRLPNTAPSPNVRLAADG